MLQVKGDYWLMALKHAMIEITGEGFDENSGH